MGLKAIARVVIKDFAGLNTNQDPNDIEPGRAVQQVNVTSERTGELRSRQGWVRVLFANPNS